VIVNLITKAITAPFSLLASAFGGGGQELGYVEFAPGSTELSDASRQRLDTLAKALTDRPALKLEATGRADAAVDEPALRVQYLDSLVRAAKAQSTGELAESVKIEPAERARWLEAAYKAADLKTKPRNVIGLAKSLPPAEMEALLLASAPSGEPALKTLADQRGDRVKAYLTAKVPPERVLLTASKLGAEGIDDKGATTRVAFALK
ncbi:MAG: AsmA family protein, partial [Methylibium sp.]|nr:AsmA family protein [Methylibium sp.]